LLGSVQKKLTGKYSENQVLRQEIYSEKELPENLIITGYY